jgi:5-methyltetrahydrofolate--homocysteine methyltransferase
MLFDERGQAADYERRVEIARRSYNLLINADFPPEDIIIDPNILAVATGMSEHDRYALDFLRAIPVILEHCPFAHISAGVSNLSFSFRGNNFIRNAMHAVFLHLAARAGLTIAIVNIAAIGLYERLSPFIRDTIESLLLCRDSEAAAKLLEIAENGNEGSGPPTDAAHSPQRPAAPQEAVIYAMLKGDDEHIEEDIRALLDKKMSVLEIVEGPLMEGMRQVGDLFGEGKMFLPQVIRSARVMKKAVAALEPYMGVGAMDAQTKMPLIIMATVKGDVHDIGKNITGTVLACNGFKVLDLGVMVAAETILDTARQNGAMFIGLSGLVSPSLDEMVNVAEEMERQGLRIPLLVGGAAASLAHSALKIAPVYGGPVVYIKDAGQAPGFVRRLASPALRPRFLDELALKYEDAVNSHNKIVSKRRLLSIEAARENRLRIDWNSAEARFPKPKTLGLIDLNDYPLEPLAALFDWDVFMAKWDSPAGNLAAAQTDARLDPAARALLDEIVQKKRLRTRGAAGIYPALSSGDDILVYDTTVKDASCKPVLKIACLRNQMCKTAAAPNVCLADFVKPFETEQKNISAGFDWLGFFAISAGFGLDELKAEYAAQKDDYRVIIFSLLADGLAEAFSEEAHRRIRREWWAYETAAESSAGRFQGIRPAFGYPCCPDHDDKRAVFRLMDVEARTGLALTESAMIRPAASLCGMYFANPASYYFSCGAIGDDQRAEWASRKNISIDTARRRRGFL